MINEGIHTTPTSAYSYRYVTQLSASFEIADLLSEFFSKTEHQSFDNLLLAVAPPPSRAALQIAKMGETTAHAFAFEDTPLLSAGRTPSSGERVPETQTTKPIPLKHKAITRPAEHSILVQNSSEQLLASVPENAEHTISLRPTSTHHDTKTSSSPVILGSAPSPTTIRSRSTRLNVGNETSTKNHQPSMSEIMNGADLQNHLPVNVALIADKSGHKLVARVDQLSQDEEEKLAARARLLLSEYGLSNSSIRIQIAQRSYQQQGNSHGRN